MARRKHYQLPASSGGGSNFLYWLLALILVIGIGWVWLRTSRSKPVAKPQPTKTARNATPTPAPVQPAVPKPAPRTDPLPPVVLQKPAPAASPAQPTQPAPRPDQFPRPARNTFEAQVAFARRVISSGSIDGIAGSQTRAATLAFQNATGLPPTGNLDAETRSRLTLDSPPTGSYTVTSNDLARLQPVATTWLGKSQQTALDFETLLELVAEKFHAHPGYIRTLNPGVNWSNSVAAGTELRVPNAAYPEPVEKAAFIRISLSAKTLQAFGANSNLLAHFPCSIAARVEKRPVGELRVAAIAPDPNYTFDPAVFPESTEAQSLGRKLILPPGPNNPVGVAWISLDKPGFGMHGTPNPEQVGRTESHGCFRLANWNAEYLIKLVSVGTPVSVEP